MSDLQRTDDWFARRCGKATGSRIADIVAKTKTGWGAARVNYLAQLVAERLTGRVEDGFKSSAMQWGIDTEPQAIEAYEALTLSVVEPVGFVDHPHISMAGASPDGLVGDDGLVEIKCPNTATHIDALLGSAIPGKYIIQMQWQMACTGRQWCDYVSFDPRMPPHLQMRVERVARDEKHIATLEKHVAEFLAEVGAKVEALGKVAA